MARNKTTNGFFTAEKKDWSHIKDQLLGCYLKPYATKVLSANRPLYYFDCFAGAGTYEGVIGVEEFDLSDIPTNYGSPIIAFASVRYALNLKKDPHKVKFFFFEKKYGKLLKENIESSQFRNEDYEVDGEDFKTGLEKVLSRPDMLDKNKSMFFYLDPFGVKDIGINNLCLLNGKRYASMELLINFNSFGAFRLACASMRCDVREKEIIESTDDTYEQILNEVGKEASHKTAEFLDGFFNSTAWRDIISEYNSANDPGAGYVAEKKISRLYKERLKSCLGYEYALDLPIKHGEHVHPKYRMVHLCNHFEGCVLMGDNMRNRDEVMKTDYIQHGQMDLFATDTFVGDENPDRADIEAEFLSILDDSWQRKEEVVAKLYDSIGIPVVRTSKIISDLKTQRKVEVEKRLKTNGKPTYYIRAVKIK